MTTRTAQNSEAPAQSLTDRSILSGARGKTAPVCLAPVTAAGMEREATEAGSTSLADWSIRTSETCRGCRLTIRHQAKKQ